MTGPVTTSPRRVAIMQPYLFPYIGYFQLAAAVDEFWLLDTVQFIQQGWMNRNVLLVNGHPTPFTISVKKKPRNDIIANKVYAQNAVRDCVKLSRTLQQSYSRAPYLETALKVVDDFKCYLLSKGNTADFTAATKVALQSSFDAIGLHTPIRKISELHLDNTLTGQDRIVAACRTIGATKYINMAGGQELYDPYEFQKFNVDLQFLEPVLSSYNQATHLFIPSLSILDVLSFVHSDDIKKMITQYCVKSSYQLRGQRAPL